MKTIWMMIRAIINAPETLHWINKYEAAKREIASLKEQIAEIKGKKKREARRRDHADP